MMDQSSWIFAIWNDVGPILSSIAISSTIVMIGVHFFAKGAEFRTTLVLVLSIATLGAISGVAGGTSRVGVVGDIIPAALALAGGVSVYLFGVDQSKGLIASLCTAAFALALALGYAAGAGNRGETDRYQATLETCRSAALNPDILKDERAFCRYVTSMGEYCAHMIANDQSLITTDAVRKGLITRSQWYESLRGGIMRSYMDRVAHISSCNWSPIDPKFQQKTGD